MTPTPQDGNIFLSHETGGPYLPRKIPKELAVSILTVCGILTTVGAGVVLRHIAPLKRLVISVEEAFVVFTIYGLAFSLIAGAARVIRRRDTVILILAATVVWGIFADEYRIPGMVRFITFAAPITVGVLLGHWATRYSLRGVRIAAGTLVPGIFCAVGGLAYHGILGYLSPAASNVGREALVGFSWGLSLGLAVGVGISLGSEVIEWLVKSAK